MRGSGVLSDLFTNLGPSKMGVSVLGVYGGADRDFIDPGCEM